MQLRYDLILDPIVILCTLLLIIIPFTVRYVNQYLHTYGDPPWKESSGDDIKGENHRDEPHSS